MFTQSAVLPGILGLTNRRAEQELKKHVADNADCYLSLGLRWRTRDRPRHDCYHSFPIAVYPEVSVINLPTFSRTGMDMDADGISPDNILFPGTDQLYLNR